MSHGPRLLAFFDEYAGIQDLELLTSAKRSASQTDSLCTGSRSTVEVRQALVSCMLCDARFSAPGKQPYARLPNHRDHRRDCRGSEESFFKASESWRKFAEEFKGLPKRHLTEEELFFQAAFLIEPNKLDSFPPLGGGLAELGRVLHRSIATQPEDSAPPLWSGELGRPIDSVLVLMVPDETLRRLRTAILTFCPWLLEPLLLEKEDLAILFYAFFAVRDPERLGPLVNGIRREVTGR